MLQKKQRRYTKKDTEPPNYPDKIEQTNENRALFNDENEYKDEQSIDLHKAKIKSHNEKEAHENSDSHEYCNSNNDTENKKKKSMKNSHMSILVM